MQHLKNFCVPHQVVNDNSSAEIQLHDFCNASEKAYGACAYIKSVDQDDIVRVHLLYTKSRVVPVKAIYLFLD